METDNNIEQNEQNEQNRDSIQFQFQKLKNYLSKNLTTVRIGLILLTLFFLFHFWTQEPSILCFKQSGGNPAAAVSALSKGGTSGLNTAAKGGKSTFASKYSKGIDKFKGKISKVGNTSFIGSGFTLLFQFVNTIFMIIGIVLILILIPMVPILVFLAISFFICRRKIWELKTL